MSDPGILCPSCGEAVTLIDSFCETCGASLGSTTSDADHPDASIRAPGIQHTTSLSPEPERCTCGGSYGSDRYCTDCGRRQSRARDHLEVVVSGSFAAVSDRGRRHHRNEDAVAVGTWGSGQIIVVCDGVSNSSRSDEASQAAAEAALVACQRSLAGDRSAVESLQAGASAAQAAVCRLTPEPGGEPPSCTFVAVVAQPGRVTVAWVGDSRAYLDNGGTEVVCMTRDHSWAEDVVVAGEMSYPEAMSDVRAHQITRWLGSDSSSAGPETAVFTTGESPSVVVCTDGLWNYFDDPAHLRRLLAAVGEEPSLLQARHLCDFANECGGRDNITVVVLRTDARTTASDAAELTGPTSQTTRPHRPPNTRPSSIYEQELHELL